MRGFSSDTAAAGVAAGGAAEREDPASRVTKHLKDFAKLPWEVDMPADKAAAVLGSYLGVPNLEPAAVLDLDIDQITGILEETTNKGNSQLQHSSILEETTNKGDSALEKALFSHADAVTQRFFGDAVYYRGIVEFSNVCVNDCGYCGIRKHMGGVKRYTIPIDEVVEVAKWAFENRMGTLMLQSGELPTPQRLAYLKELVARVHQETLELDMTQRGLDPKAPPPADAGELGLRVALSVGELPEEHYQELYDAGARRYLLRIESSNPELYAALHPDAMSWQRRVDCLNSLKKIGYMVGTGVMVGLPGQTLRDLAGDIRFFKEMNANMIGMGPYITEAGTPVADMWESMFGHVDKKSHMKAMFDLTTRMNSLARIVVGSANISATTALQAIEPNGREIALRRGCNVLMPILTPTKYREHYQLYEGKPCITDTAEECRKCLNARVSMIGKRLRQGAWGDPPNFLAPVAGVDVRALQQAQSAGVAGAGSAARSYHTSARTYSSAAAQPAAAAAAAADAALPPGPGKGSDVPRINIGVFGVMNAGKSTLMNAITRQETSIVDATPGTTADVKVSLMELHELGPVKLFDTAGIDEAGQLGEKKRRKTLSALKECDVSVVVVDVQRQQALLRGAGLQESLQESSSSSEALQRHLQESLKWEQGVLQDAGHYGVVPLLLLNLKGCRPGPDTQALVRAVQGVLDPSGGQLSLTLDLHDAAADVPGRVASFLQDGVTRSRKRPATRSLPDWALTPEASVFLNIPMDAETPSMRLLRPQALVQEEAIRYWATTTAYRMDLAAARSSDASAVERERQRFMRALQPLLQADGPKLLVTDSQAMDIVHPWTLDASGRPLLPITTFSIAMIHRQSGGKLPLFVEGIKALQQLVPGDRVLIAEACNHNRITDHCNDIGMVQIPQKLERLCGKGLQLEHAFGREYPDLAEEGSSSSSSGAAQPKFKLALHCGGCMIDAQKMRARIADMEDAGVPVTNYGLFLSWVQAPEAMRRVLEPWGVDMDAAARKFDLTVCTEQAALLDLAAPNSDDADLNDAINELLDSSSTIDPKPYGNRAPDASDLPSHQGRKRCGTPAGSSEQRAAAEQRFQARLQALQVQSSEAAEGGGAGGGDDGVEAAATGTVADIKVFFHILQYKQPVNRTQGVFRLLGYVSQNRIDQQMRLLNAAYGQQFSFSLRGVQWYTTSRGYLFTAGQSSATERQVKTSICARAGNGAASVLNLYTWQPGQDVLGWATMPDWFVDTPDRDGVVILHSVITGGGDPAYAQGDTLVHEVGHWLGLYHVFQGGCSKNAANGGDFVADTPAVASPNFKCVRVDSCPNLPGTDLVKNYMDYTDDRCVNSFTPGQKRRMVQQWRAYRAR
ncbi:hypothetical protein OEZ86_005171 [Tetradesmus obliquus]|nr:hypothetical protein OEZ86_005171 [Tetradesmus obliquus]